MKMSSSLGREKLRKPREAEHSRSKHAATGYKFNHWTKVPTYRTAERRRRVGSPRRLAEAVSSRSACWNSAFNLRTDTRDADRGPHTTPGMNGRS
jgi:hypothetical protein